MVWRMLHRSDCLLQNAPLMMVAEAAALPTTSSPSDIAAQLRKCPTGLQEEQLLQLSSRALARGHCLTAALALEQLRGQLRQAEAWQWARQCSGAAIGVEPDFKCLGLLEAKHKALLPIKRGAALPLSSWASMTLWAAWRLVLPAQRH